MKYKFKVGDRIKCTSEGFENCYGILEIVARNGIYKFITNKPVRGNTDYYSDGSDLIPYQNTEEVLDDCY